MHQSQFTAWLDKDFGAEGTMPVTNCRPSSLLAGNVHRHARSRQTLLKLVSPVLIFPVFFPIMDVSYRRYLVFLRTLPNSFDNGKGVMEYKALLARSSVFAVFAIKWLSSKVSVIARGFHA